MLSSIAILVHRPDRLGALFPPALHVSRARLVPFPRFERHLAQEALIVRETVLVQPATGDGLDHRAPRLGVVRAVVEPAFPRQGGDVVERVIDRRLVRPELQLTHPRRVDEQGAARELHELP